MTYTHRGSKWTRESLRDGSSRWIVRPTDGSGDRTVRFLSAYSWQNDPNDDRALAHTDRVVLLEGDPLPDWAVVWLTDANAKRNTIARQVFRDAIADADNAPFRY